jgi:heme exporter protein A
VLSVKNLVGGRGDKELFGPLTFNVEAGSLLWVQGVNGVGKTTLLKMIASLLSPMGGCMRWKAKKIHHLDAEYLSDIVYIGHAAGLQTLLTPLEYLKMALIQARGLCIDNKYLLKALEEAGLGLELVSQKFCGALSKGQQQRLNLARCLIQPGLCWLMDEPLSALDQQGQAWFKNAMVHHVKQGGIIVVISHSSLSLICAQIPHQILVL